MPRHSSPTRRANAIAALGASTRKIHLKPQEIQYLASDYATYLDYHRGVSRLRKALESSTPVHDSEQRQLLRKGPNAEKCLKKSLMTALDVINSNEDLFFGPEGATNTICNRIDDLRVCSDPGLFGPEVQEAITKTGVTLREFAHYHDVVFGEKNYPHLKKCLEGLGANIKPVLKQTQQWAHHARFPESESELRKRGLISISGGDNPTPYIVGGAALVIGVGIIVASGGLAAGVIPGVLAIANGTAGAVATVGAGIAVGGATLLATEAYQDYTGTQDNNWKIVVEYKQKIPPLLVAVP